MEKILSETRRPGLLRAGLLAGGLGFASLLLASCGDVSGGTPGPESSQATSPHVEAEYYENGSRILRYRDYSGEYADILQVCDGGDLLEQTVQTGTRRVDGGAAGNSVSRSVDHLACTDGILTESDFQVER